MTSELRPIHQVGGSTLVTAGSLPGFSGAGFFWAELREGEKISAQQTTMKGRSESGWYGKNLK
jgi:hypothetical protein